MSIARTICRAALLGLIANAAAAAASPDPIYTALRTANISDTFVAENIVLRRDTGVVTLKSGVIGFTAPVMGRDTVAIFQGDGEFTLTAVQAIEKNYFKQLTGEDTVKETFDRA